MQYEHKGYRFEVTLNNAQQSARLISTENNVSIEGFLCRGECNKAGYFEATVLGKTSGNSMLDRVYLQAQHKVIEQIKKHLREKHH